jgi:hypothetical protein
MKNFKNKCKSKLNIWNLKVGDITDYKIEEGFYRFLYFDNGVEGWDHWGNDNEEFLNNFELLDIKQDKSHNKALIKLIKYADR